MKKEDLVVGKKYINCTGCVLKFVGFDKENDPVFKPLGITPFVLFDKEDEIVDPMCKSGHVGFAGLPPTLTEKE